MAARLGIVPGLSLDLTTNDPDDGMPWDFSKIEQRNKAMRRWHEEKQLFIIGTPHLHRIQYTTAVELPQDATARS